MPLKHILGDLPAIKILDFFIEQRGSDFTRAEIAHDTEIGATAMKNDFPRLIECGVLFETRKIGGVSLYALDMENEMTQSLIEFDAKLTEYHMKRIEDGLDDTYGDGPPDLPED
jgi:hypothetical protein